MRLDLVFAMVAVAAASACTYSNVSATPILLPDGSTAYRYSGRANFNYQQAEADKVMAETCAQQGMKPVVVAQDTQVIGIGAAWGQGAAAAGANRQQEILFKCVNRA